eukprot:TRINITY_DN17696_c0_g1_i1.p1 TRINITY_DN17696_c0_g1~~TRINITY_DN17696_c0_g1_i1.p1  ORF type:complete len:879 (-),score=169.37 TRINITY_DN17696_c0_g1_i1:57-2657(-)
MAGHFFGLFSGERASKPAYSLEHLQALHNRLQALKDTDEQNRDSMVEVIRQITEALLWGEQNGHDDNFFDFFCEKGILADFVRVLGLPKVPKTVKVQLLQTLSMLIQNIRRDTSLYYLFSNNYVNQLIATEFEWADEEILTYYISFLKSLALRLNKETIKFFFNEHSQQFPLYTEAVRFFDNHDQMVRTSVRTLALQVYSVEDLAMRKFVLAHSKRAYFKDLSSHLRNLWAKLNSAAERAHNSGGEAAAVAAVQEANEQQQDLVMYLGDVLGLDIPELTEALAENVLRYACFPALLGSLMVSTSAQGSSGASQEPSQDAASPQLTEAVEGEATPVALPAISRSCALFLLHQVFDCCRSRPLLEPLASALLRRRLPVGLALRLRMSPPEPLPQAMMLETMSAFGSANENSGGSSSSVSPSGGYATCPDEELEPSDCSLRSELLRMLKADPSDTCVLLVAGVLKSCLSASNLLPQELLVESGLLPPWGSWKDLPRTSPGMVPLEVLLAVSEALEQHASLRVVVVQVLCRLCLDVAFTPQARGYKGSTHWREQLLATVAVAIRSAARQVRSHLHGPLGDGFLDIFSEEWDQEQSLIPASFLRAACSSKYCLLPPPQGAVSGLPGQPLDWSLPASHSERQLAAKAIRILLMIRRLRADLAHNDQPEHSSAPPKPPPTPTGGGGGGVINSALAPVEAPSAAESPLWVPEEISDGFVEGKSFELGRIDRIVCGVSTPEGRHTRYLVLHPYLLLLVQPDLVSPGWAVAKTLVPVRHVDAHIDQSDPRMLRLTLRLVKGAQCPGEASAYDQSSTEADYRIGAEEHGSATFLLTLSFEDVRRCHCAELHLRKRRTEVRDRLTKSLEAFIDGLCSE